VSKPHFYYRCTNSAVIAAVTAFFDKCAVIEKAGDAFAARFGGEARFYSRFGTSFGGVAFKRDKPPKDEALWTKPDKHGMRWPKRTGEAGRGLRNEWELNWPKAEAKDEEWLAPLGLTTSIESRPGIALDTKNKVVYVETNKPLTIDGVEELTATQYITLKEGING
jgi:hypothetical protein